MNRTILLFCLTLTVAGYYAVAASTHSGGLDDPYRRDIVLAAQDTIPPPQPRYGDYIHDKTQNPFDLKDPNAVEQNVDFDPATGQYIISEKIGDDYFRPPTYMTFEEYMEYTRKEEERRYFDQLSGVSTGKDGLSSLDPFAKFDVKSSLIDRLFGGNTVDIRPQGSIDLTFGVDFQRLDNPILTERQRKQGGFDFDMDIQMNVTGKIGEKLNLTTNYNTSAVFDFDNQIKLDYNSDLFSEDEIIKKIEAGNVSLPLRGTLIQGAESLFGIKAETQFGHLRLTGILSQQKSQREAIQLQGGSQLQEFEVKADEYDENRHFFLSHYNRESFEGALKNLPQINTLFHLENLEVWITNDRNEVEDVRDIVAFADLGEPTRLVNPQGALPLATPKFQEIYNGKALPDNEANGLYDKLIARGESLRDIDKTVSILQSSEFGLQQARDFEKVSARRLDPREYTYNAELGFISVNVNVLPDQVLAVSYQYKYNGEIYQVGEMSVSRDNVSTDPNKQTPQVLFVKMLKSTTQRIDVPTWDLMMKNVYSTGAYQVNPTDFKLDVYYEDPGKGLKRFLPKSNLEGRPLIRVFNLDRLNTQGDPQPDGIFDFVPGVTINPTNGRIIFPVLEPFGQSLADKLDAEYRDTFTYPELYTQTLFQAREYPEKNRYVIKGSYKSSVSSEISLGAFNIPPNSVRVTAGGALLVEGRDYEVDYGTGKVRILNDAILSSGVPVNVSFEDNTLFGFQSKTMMGLRADYELDPNFTIGATFLQLFERPFTFKTNIGDDPINNKIYGLDLNFSREAPWLTKAVDALPFFSTKAPSNISVSAEAAYLNPGHARAINEDKKNKDGVSYIDDFEGSASGFNVTFPVTQWQLASVPQDDGNNNNPLFPEATVNTLASGANRARLNWYLIDPVTRSSSQDRKPYTGIVPQEEVFPNVQVPIDQARNFRTFDLSFYPGERGPYNFDTPSGYGSLTRGVTVNGDSLILRDPQTRWGGIMRALNNNDFQSANIEFLEFWMLSPFLDPDDAALAATDGEKKEGTLYINLGNISEDILKDSRKFFENGLPGPTSPNRPTDETIWSVVPVGQQITRAFDNDPGNREAQDVGFDGLNDDGEREKFASYVSAITALNATTGARVARDPSNDNFRYYNDASFPNTAGVLERYRDFNNPQGNSRSNQDNQFRQSATNLPDAEDLNQDNTLNETESYFQYEIPIKRDQFNQREIDVSGTPFITDKIEDPTSRRVWYRFRVPLNGPQKKSIGGIRDFRSIRFMRLYMRGFQEPTVLRFAKMELVRNQWRRYTQDLTPKGSQTIACDDQETTVDVDAVNIEENSRRTPFNYTLPEGIQREQSLGVFTTLQNEQSLSMRIDNLCDGDARAIFKNTDLDLRVYDKLKMFVHAEERNPVYSIPEGELRIFVRIGSDFQNNYYEYEIPLSISDPDKVSGVNPVFPEYKREVWKPENEFNFQLTILRQLKEERNQVNANQSDEYIKVLDPSDPLHSHVIKVKGNPNLGYVRGFMIGVRNPKNDGAAYSTEIWVNELRVAGLDERGGLAAVARMDMQLADLGNLTLSGNLNSVGFGALDDGVTERSREEIKGYDVATNLQLGKFFPEKWGIRLPFYAQVSNVTKTPEYDPYDFDIKLKDKINQAQTQEERKEIREQAEEVTNIKTYNFTDVGKDRTGGGDRKPMPWDIENFSVSYSHTETEFHDPLIEFQRDRRETGGLDYKYSRPATYLEPFKKVGGKSEWLRWLREFNFNPLPNSFFFTSIMERQFAKTRYRFAGVDEKFNSFFNKRFTWERDYDLTWDLTKSLKLTFNASSLSYIDEPDEIRMLEDPTIANIDKYRRDSIWSSIKDLGRPKGYEHSINLSYNLPLRQLPFMDWMQVRAQYQAGYRWNRAALNADSLGNVIQNNQNRQITADLNFEKFYDKFGYLKKINKGKTPSRTGRSRNTDEKTPTREPRNSNNKDDDNNKKKKDREPSAIERVVVRPLLLIRKVRLNYQERFETVVPGFTPETKLLGLSEGFKAPGWDFVAGIQPKIRTLNEGDYYKSGDWLYENRKWITHSLFLNQDVIQRYTQTYDGKLTLEPFKDFRVDIEANRSYTQDHTETFKNLDVNGIDGYAHAVPSELGSMTVTYSALKTLFKGKDTDVVDQFNKFSNNRLVVSQRLGTGTHEDPNLGQLGYTEGYGRNQQDVLIPAFIATYTGVDPNTVSLDLFETMPRLNWRLNYNGLSKIPLFKNIFSNFNLTHSYRSTLTVNSYRTNLSYLRGKSKNVFIDTVNYNFFPRLEIPDVAIQEGFAPLLGIEANLQNGMSFNFEYVTQRSLSLNVTNTLLSENRSKEATFGFGYLMRGVEIGFLTGNKRKKRPSNTDQQQPNQQQQRPGSGGRGGQLQSQDLDIQFLFSLRDDITVAQKLDGAEFEPTRGNYSLQISPSAEYKLNRRLSLRLFFDYRKTVPKTSAGYPRLDTSGGVVVRFQLN
ncbi:MAG: cell surface protein SprA [Lewinellaceae bacterium]|nr:cell surface protein SprA [Lewinellaceae bacterium]